ncbi:MAG: carboxypeptidase regulatory-like domain-containing protein [Haloplanus sp.]
MTRTLVCVLVVALVVGPALPAVAQSDGEMVTVTVAVRNTEGAPVDDADLDVTWDGGSTTATTAGNGKAFVDVPAGADVTVSIDHPEYVRDNPYVISDASERTVEITVYRESSLHLEVSGPDGPVAGATVLVERGGLDVATGTTDENGVFETGVLQAGDYTLTVTKAGYYTRRKPIRIEGDVSNRVALRPGSVAVDITVVDPTFDPPRPVSGAAVNLTGITTERSGRNGSITVRAPVNTRTTLRVTKRGYRSVSRTVRIGETNASLTVDISRTPSLTLEAANDRIVAGERAVLTLTDAYGDPVAGASILLDGERIGTTDADGELAVPIYDPGRYTLQARVDGRTSNEVRIEVIGEGTPTPTEPAATQTPTPTATATRTPTPTATTTGGAPGFTPLNAVFAVVAGLAVGLLRRR